MTNLKPLLTACPPRPIAQAGDQYAADVVRGLEEELATPESAADFLETTYLTQATRNFLRTAVDRLALGRSSTSSTVYQLYSRYGGGKTHSLLLLAAAAKYPTLPYWGETAEIDPVEARFIAFDGEKQNVVSGYALDDQGNRARSLAGHLLYYLGGPEALQEFAEGDAILTDPASETFRRLIGDEPVVIVIDELVHYINRVNQLAANSSTISTEGVLTTISALANAVVNSPRAVLVITTPEESSQPLQEAMASTVGDAYHADSLALTAMLERIDSQLGRIIVPIAPSNDADLPAILRKRLFYNVDEEARSETASAYSSIAARNGRETSGMDFQSFHNAYPFHPSMLNIITGRLSANRNFQRVRGTLRLVGNTILEMKETNSNAPIIHPYQATPRSARIRDEVINRTGFSELDPAIDTDIAGLNSTVAKIGNDLTEYAAVTMLLGTIAPEASNGLYADQIADAILSPQDDDFGVIAGAIEQFLSRAIYVDDSPDTQRKRFSKDANIMKELLEARDGIIANTTVMSELLSQAINSAYRGSRTADVLDIILFPSRQSNVPDNANRASLGIVNPGHWNWTDAGNAANGMTNQDLLDLHRHSSANDGNGPRQYPNNALLLAAHDGNLTRIREDIATMEAADRLLRDTARALPQHRRETLESMRAASEKNATTGIQNKFTHLFSAGNTPQHQWPELHSHIEHRTLESITDAVGKGQEGTIQALGDRLLRGANAGLNKNTWAAIGLITTKEGCTLGQLQEYFARTPDARILINDVTWRAVIANGVRQEALHIVTPSGEINPTGYDSNWLVWAKDFAPTVQPKGDGGANKDIEEGGGGKEEDSRGTRETGPTAKSFTSGRLPGRAAYEAVRQFMSDNNQDWPAMISCRVRGTTPALADQVASIAQGNDGGISITLLAQNEKIQVAVRNSPPSEFKEYSNPAKRLLSRAGVSQADVTIELLPEDALRILDKLNSRDEANVTVSFQ